MVMRSEMVKYEEKEISSIMTDWNNILVEMDLDVRIVKINEFIQSYAMYPYETVQRYLNKAQKEIYRIDDEKDAYKDWIDAKQTNTIFDYVDFVTKHPHSDYCDDARRLIERMKLDVLSDMKKIPFKYFREEMYEYISRNLLTNIDLIKRNDLLTERAYSHIKRYPRLIDEQENLPICSENPENDIISGNIDVLFFGTCGSGGKTCLMASLMSLVDESSDFLFQEFNNNKECDNTYGTYLADYMHTNRLPPATDTHYIQVVNTLIKCDNKYNGVSFVEFAGEQVHAIAGNKVQEGLSGGRISTSLIKILNNNNRKIIILTLDPTNLKDIQICEPSIDYDGLAVYEADVLSCVLSHFKNAPKFMRNVIGFHTIISKSDTWLKGSYSSSIHNAIEQLGASGLLLQIDQLCKQYKINKHLNFRSNPIPFSIGRFMVGDTYEFDNNDAKNLLHVIINDIEESEKHGSILSRLSDYFNS